MSKVSLDLVSAALIEDHLAAVPANCCPLCKSPLPVRPTSKLLRDDVGHRAYWNGADVGLTAGEYRLLTALVFASGQCVGYRQLYTAMSKRPPGFVTGQGDWGYKGNVRSMAKRVRQKFLALDPSFACIVNFAGVGYFWRER